MFIKIICLFFLSHYAQSALIDLSCEDINIFVKVQNAARLLIAEGKMENQPPASEMNSLVWDEELAAKAERWASTYPKTINPDQTIPSGRFLTSQSISVYTNQDKNFKVNLKIQQILWCGESYNYTYGPFSKDLIEPSHAPVGHYTQIIWSNSIYLGCSMSEDIEDNIKKVYVVCEYGPSANILGQEPYKSGPPSNKLICAADEYRCKHPYSDKCPGEE